MAKKVSADAVVKDIQRKTRKKYSAEQKIRIIPEGLRGEGSIVELCRREGIPTNLYYRWSKDFLEAGKKFQHRAGHSRTLSPHRGSLNQTHRVSQRSPLCV